MSRYLTVGTADANQQPPGFWGRFSARTVVGSPATPGDQADVAVAMVLNDVRNSSNLTDYTGELRVRAAYRRQTDRASGPTESGGTEPATGTDTTWGFVMNCAATAAANTGSTCRLVTSVDALNPGAVKEGGRAIMELGQMQVYDGGPDGLAQTQDNLVFAVQGLFVP
jgi:hypothetical protein